MAHCGVDPSGRFLNTLVLIDIATSWTECFALLQKCEAEVIAAIQNAQDLLPVAILGFDSDNGSEFINHGLIAFCRDNQITFTRSRAYKKNDQAHVEERNGSVVRRTIGYDRYEGCAARDALQLYLTMRLYVNFFQPSMKLTSKQRDGAKVSRQYDSAKTPYRRMLDAPSVSKKAKSALRLMYSKLDPVSLLNELEQLQDAFWKHAWRQNSCSDVAESESLDLPISIMPAVDDESQLPTIRRSRKEQKLSAVAASVKTKETETRRKYRQTRKPRNQGKPHNWRTRKDPFENVIEEIEMQFQRNQNITAKQLLTILMKKFPGDFSEAQRRTLMRRLNKLRQSLDGQAIPSPSRKTYPKHIQSRSKLSPEQWQQVSKEVTACFVLNPEISAPDLLSILQRKFPDNISDAQIPTLRRRLKQLREAGTRKEILALPELSKP